jgi:hypothetical protein
LQLEVNPMQTPTYSSSPTGAMPLATAQALADAARAAEPAWTTRFDPAVTRTYGVAEAHGAVFMPAGWRPGPGAKTVSMLIPECELQFVEVLADGEPLAIISRRKSDFNIKRWLRNACELAAERMAALSLACDTAEQAALAARRAAKWLPKTYARVALERMYRSEDRIKEQLN